ncbi:MAG TPA: hypothetical protein VKI61_00460, partial [Chitinophagaceae bacterium]|nr:hypothetical protein [Chitinophagaceae bacterium]
NIRIFDNTHVISNYQPPFVIIPPGPDLYNAKIPGADHGRKWTGEMAGDSPFIAGYNCQGQGGNVF